MSVSKSLKASTGGKTTQKEIEGNTIKLTVKSPKKVEGRVAGQYRYKGGKGGLGKVLLISRKKKARMKWGLAQRGEGEGGGASSEKRKGSAI